MQRFQVMHRNQPDGICGRGADDVRDRFGPSREQIFDFLAYIWGRYGFRKGPSLGGSPIHQLGANRDAAKAFARSPEILNRNAVHQRMLPLRYANPVHEALIDRCVVTCDKLASHGIHAAVGPDEQIRADARTVLEMGHSLAIGIQLNAHRPVSERHGCPGPGDMI